MKCQLASIVPPSLGKWPIFHQIGIASRLYPGANSWGINLRAGLPKRGPDKAFHSPAPCAAAIQDLRENHGLYSSRAVAVWLPELPATSLFLCAVFSPASRSNSLELASLKAILGQTRMESVFTRTQLSHGINIFALELSGGRYRNEAGMNQKFNVPERRLGEKCPCLFRRKRSVRNYARGTAHFTSRTRSLSSTFKAPAMFNRASTERVRWPFSKSDN